MKQPPRGDAVGSQIVKKRRGPNYFFVFMLAGVAGIAGPQNKSVHYSKDVNDYETE